MATFYTNVATNQQTGVNFPGAASSIAAPPSGTGFNDPVLELGNCDQVIATYTMTGNEVAGDIINIAYLNSGSLVDPHSYVSGNGIATSATISVGDLDTASSANRYCTTLNVVSSTLDAVMTGGAAAASPYFLSADSWITATFATLNTPVANKVLTFWLNVRANR